MTDCKWPEGMCACYEKEAIKPDYAGRVWMHCEEGLSMSKVSMSRFVMFCLKNRVEIGSMHPFNPKFDSCQVSAAVRLRPDQFADFEAKTGGKLRSPPQITLNSSSPRATLAEIVKGEQK